MNIVLIRDENVIKQVEVATQYGVVELSRQELSSMFGLIEDGIKHHQVFGAEFNGLTFEMPLIRREDVAMFHLGSQFGHCACQEEFNRRRRQWKASTSEEIAQIELENLRMWLRQGHADKANISMLETWLVWWHARVAHWEEYMIEAMKSDDQYMVPRTNLAESIHGSWLASNDGIKYISLYTACQANLTATLLQQSRYDSFLKVPLETSNVIDLTNEVEIELNARQRRLSADGEVQTIRRKRSGTIETPIAEGYSHRSKYEYVTQNVRQHRQRQEEHKRSCTVDEINIHPSRWAIRRTNPGSAVRCQGYLQDKGRKCNELIDQKGRLGLLGVPAPCFQGMVKITATMEKKQFVWFCGDDVDHTKDPSNIVSEKPVSRPVVWPVAIGTCLHQKEIDALWLSGFDLHTSSDDSLMQTSKGKQDQMQGTSFLNNDMDVRPMQRDGKNVITYRTITKEMTKRIQRANEMVFIISTCKVVVENEHVKFIITKVGDKENEESYKVARF
ncbi:hypothetical protein L7F22_014670 [Adiantum nelumboides]|nr:hypothetical protein [Adiantum nelumboides]